MPTSFSKFLELANGRPQTIDLSSASNALAVAFMQLLGSTSGTLTHQAAATTTSYGLIWPAAQGTANQVLAQSGTPGTLAWTTLTSGITQLTGDVTAGPGSGSQAATVVAIQGSSVSNTAPTDAQLLIYVNGTSKWTPASVSVDATISNSGALTLATVNSNVGTFASVTVNAKGLVTAAADLSGDITTSGSVATAAATQNNITSIPNLATVGTITSGAWHGTAIGPTYGGTGLTSYTTGDTLYASATNVLSKLGIGSSGQVLTVSGGIPSWATPTNGTVTTVSVATTNGFAGTVANASTTPAITISTTVNSPVLAGNGTAISAASTTGSGSTVVLSASPTISGTLSTSAISASGAINMNSNQINNLANGTASGDAVNYSQLSAISTGLIWQNSINDPDLVDDSQISPPGSPVYSITYIISGITTYTFTVIAANATAGAVYTDGTYNYKVQTTIVSGTTLVATGNGTPSGSTLTKVSGTGDSSITFSGAVAGSTTATGAWTGFEGHAVWWDGTEWIDLSTGLALGAGSPTAVQIGDRFAVAIATAGASAHIDGSFISDGNYLIQVTSNTIGAFAYTFIPPMSNYAVSVTAPGSQHYGSSFTYVSGTSSWVDFSGPSKINAGNALSYSGNTLNVRYDGPTINLNGSNQLYVPNSGIGTAQLANSSVTYAKIQNESASTLLGNPTGGSAAPSEITLGATLAFSGSALQTVAMTGDVTSSANSFATTVAKIQGTTVSGTTGTGNVVFSASPTLTGTISAVNMTLSGNLVAPTIQVTATYTGSTLTANTTYALRWGIEANSETAGNLYVADWNTSSFDEFYVVGLYNSTSSTTTGSSITVTSKGMFTLGSSDTTFASGDRGKAVWLGSAGAILANSAFSPSSGDANERVGTAITSTTMWIDVSFQGIS